MEPSENKQEPEKEEQAQSSEPVEPARGEVELSPLPAGIEEPAPPKVETGVRRFFRRLVRWLLLLVVLFGLGVAAMYFWLYRPLTERYAGLQGDVQQTRQQLEQTGKDLKTVQDQNTSLQAQVATAQAKLSVETNRADLQAVLTDVVTARLALANKDGASAQAALQAAKTHLATLLPAAEKQDSAQAAAVSARLELVMNELNRDPKTAISDLDVLTRNLQELGKALGIGQ